MDESMTSRTGIFRHFKILNAEHSFSGTNVEGRVQGEYYILVSILMGISSQ
eukprot:UN13272